MWSHEAGESYCERAGPTTWLSACSVINMTSLLVHQGNSSWIWRLLKILCWLDKLCYCASIYIATGFLPLLSSMTHFSQANSELWSMGSELAQQINHSELTILDSHWACTHLPIQKPPFTNLWGVVCIFNFNFLSWAFIDALANCHMYTWFQSAIWLVKPYSGAISC